MNKEKNFVSAVIYTHNVEHQITSFLRLIMQTLEENFEHSEIICVDDCSSDNSVMRIKELSVEAVSANVSVVHMSYFHGLELSMNAGVDLAIGDFVLEFDSVVADFEGADIMRIYSRALAGYDIVSASPDKRQRTSSTMFYRVFDTFTELPYKMYTERFRILSRRVINRISSMNKAVPYRKAIYANSGLRTDHVVYQTKENLREHPESREDRKYRRGLAIDSLLLFTSVGYRFSMTMTAFMILSAVFVALYAVITYLTRNPVAGWTTTILFLSFSFFGLFAILTIIIKYLQILVDLVFRRKHYSFESIEKLTK